MGRTAVPVQYRLNLLQVLRDIFVGLLYAFQYFYHDFDYRCTHFPSRLASGRALLKAWNGIAEPPNQLGWRTRLSLEEVHGRQDGRQVCWAGRWRRGPEGDLSGEERKEAPRWDGKGGQ
jgi:hypothetical protein